MAVVVWILAALLSSATAEFESQTCNVDRETIIQPGAQAMLGGIISAHRAGTGGYGCGSTVGSMQSYEALRYSLDLVNKKDEFLNGEFLYDYYVPGVRLGMRVIDVCRQFDAALAAVSSFFPSLSAQTCSSSTSNLTLGLVSNSGSGSTAKVAGYVETFDIPFISYSASAPALTFSGEYPNFMRTAPPDSDLMMVMGQLLTKLSWKFVVVIYEDSLYGREGYNALRPILANAGICLTAAIMADSANTSPATMRDLLGQVVQTDTVGTIFLGSGSLATALLKEGGNVNGAGKLQWIFTDSINLDSTFTNVYPRGVLVLVPASRYIVEFEDHWVRIDEESPSAENPWFQEWYMEKYQCNLAGFNKYPTQCSALYQGLTAAEKERKKRLSFVQDQYVEPAVHAVFSYAYALREAQRVLCGGNPGICPQLAALSQTDFLNNYLKKVDFTYAAQERVPSLASDQYAPYKAAKRLKFDSRGDIFNPSFSVWNYNDLPRGEENSTSYKFREVGNYIGGRMSLNIDDIRMYTEDRMAPITPMPSSPCPSRGCFPCLGVPQDMKYYFKNGDIVINGIFSLHEKGSAKFTCGDLVQKNPLFLEAMIYAVEEVNKNNLLNRVTLGGLGIDDCMDPDRSSNFIVQVQKGMHTVKDSSGNSLDPRNVEAYTGAHTSPLTIPLAKLMDVFMQPMVGYAATSAKLDSYKYYLKAVPGIEEEFRAIIMVMKNYNWNYTQVMYSVDAYDADDVMLFRRMAARAGICVVASHRFDSDSKSGMVVNALSQHVTVRPVVLLLSPENHRSFLQVLNSTKTRNMNDFIVTATFDNQGVQAGLETTADGFMVVRINLPPLMQFYNRLAALRVNSYQDNPWFGEWFEAEFSCYLNSNNRRGFTMPCNTGVAISTAPMFSKDLRVIHVINSVYAIARGLNSLLTKYCGSGYSGVCPQFVTASRMNKGMDLQTEILKVTFPIEETNPILQFFFTGRSAAYPYTVYISLPSGMTRIGTVMPYANTMTDLTVRPSVTSLPSCPQPCTECLYMFAFQNYWYIDGDLIIPAIFDVHYSGTSMYNCGPLRINNGVQYTEAFKYALDYVNDGRSGVNLNGVRLGGLGFDGCSSPARATAIINGVMGRTFPIMDNSGSLLDISKLVAWLTYESESTMEVAGLLKMINMPLVTPAATAPQLMDKSAEYATVFRTIPSDSIIARAMANWIRDRGWKYVITLNEPDAGCRKTRDLFRQYLKEMGICVIANLEFETDGSVGVILNSIYSSTTQVVAVFADPDRHVPEMLQLKEKLYPAPDIIFISNRYWELDHMGLTLRFPLFTSTVKNSLSFRLASSTVADFVSYLSGLKLSSNKNPWLPEYYQALFKCNLGGNRVYENACTSTTFNLGTSQDLYQHIYSLTTINAVHALAVGLKQVLADICGVGYSGVCSNFLTNGDTWMKLMVEMERETFTDVASILFDFIKQEANRGYSIMQHDNNVKEVATVSMYGNVTYSLGAWDPRVYSAVKSECPDDCLVCEGLEASLNQFSFIEGDLYIVGLFDVHTEGATPYTCGGINEHQGLQLLEAFNFAINYTNHNRNLFGGRLRGVQIGGIGIDVCKSPTRAANIVANIHSGNIRLNFGSFEIDRRRILAYVGPFDTYSTIRVADVLNAIGIPQVTYGATGLQLQDPVKYPYLLRSVPADDKQARAIISYLKNFNMTNIQLVTTAETIGQSMTKEFMRLATLNLVCISHNYTLGRANPGNIGAEAVDIVQKIVANDQSRVVILLANDPLPILQAAGNNFRAREEFLWVATDKWGYDTEFLEKLAPLLGDRSSKKNVIIFDIETADVPLYDQYLEGKTPGNHVRNPWFLEFYQDQFKCTWSGTGANCDATRGLSRADDYIQDPYVLYVVNAVLSAGLGIDGALRSICGSGYDEVCPRFYITGNRRDIVLSNMKQVNFTDDTLQPFYFEPTGESSRGYHIYNVTTDSNRNQPSYVYENVGSYNDTHFLKLDITYDLGYQAYCTPYDDCVCVNQFPEIIPSRYMLKPSNFELNLVYIGEIHQRSPSNPFACSNVNVGADFFKMMAFFYAIDRVNMNADNRYPESLRLGGIALDTCSTTLRLEQDIFNLLSGYPLCDTGESGQVVAPSSVVAFVPDGNANSLPVSSILASTGITSVSPSATHPELRQFFMSEHFLSVVPPDDLQATVILQLMERLNWNYASVIYTDEASMVAAKNELLRQTAVGQKACIGQAVKLPMSANIQDAEAALDQVSQQVGARAVVLFTLPAHTRLLLQAAQNRGQAGRFIWIGTSAWGRHNEALSGLEQQASGAIVLQPYSLMVDDFHNFIKSLTYTNRQGIPKDWFEEIYQTLHRCKLQDAGQSLPFSNLCSKKEVITDDKVPYEPSVLHTIIAVYMVAQGLNEIPECRTSNLAISACITRLQNRNDAIYQAIRNAQWNVLPTLLGNDFFTFTFTGSDYGNIGFNIFNYHSSGSGSGYVYSRLGRYTDSLQLNTVSYQGLSLYDVGVIPTSNCAGIECKCQGPMGIFGVPSQWSFIPRRASVVVTEEGRTYLDPATGELFYVEKIPDVSSRFKDMWGVAVATLAAIGVAVSLALFVYLLVVYPVRGGTSVLGYVLCFGIILLYAMVFAFVAHVNVELCGLRRFGLGLCYAIVYSALFVKLVDCWRSRKKEDMFEVKYNKLGHPLGLFMVTVLLVLVQVIISAEWLILRPPEVVRIFYNQQYWPRCTPDDFYDQGLVLSLCYIMVLILLTMFLGFFTFNNVKNHRESRWILGMAILSVPTWVIWCAWAAMGAIKTRDAAVAVGLLINATILLLLGPVRKMYLLNKNQALIEEEERNNLQNERASKADDYSTIGYNNQYDNSPQFHDRASGIGSARGYRYPPSSVGRSAR